VVFVAYNFVAGMRKLFFSFVVLLSLVFLWTRADFGEVDKKPEKQEILRFALVSDSENDNSNLQKALTGAKDAGASFVIGLGDWTQLGMLDDLIRAKEVFDASGLEYFVTAGDRDLWDSRDKGEPTLLNFNAVFGKSSHVINKGEVRLIIVDNADIYKGISDVEWELLNKFLGNGKEAGVENKLVGKSDTDDLTQSPNRHPNPDPTAKIAATTQLVFVFAHKTPFHPQSAHIMGADNSEVSEQAKEFMKVMEDAKIDGFFSGDLHFFAGFNSPGGVKITTVGATSAERNFQGPRYAIVTVYNDYSWEVEDREVE